MRGSERVSLSRLRESWLGNGLKQKTDHGKHTSTALSSFTLLLPTAAVQSGTIHYDDFGLERPPASRIGRQTNNWAAERCRASWQQSVRDSARPASLMIDSLLFHPTARGGFHQSSFAILYLPALLPSIFARFKPMWSVPMTQS